MRSKIAFALFAAAGLSFAALPVLIVFGPEKKPDLMIVEERVTHDGVSIRKPGEDWRKVKSTGWTNSFVNHVCVSNIVTFFDHEGSQDFVSEFYFVRK